MNNNMDNLIASTSTAPPTRKRGRPRKEKATVPTTTATPATPASSATLSTPTSANPDIPVAKKRGRPRKVQKVEATDLQKITNIKKFIMKYHPSVANDTEKITENSFKSLKMAKNLWANVINIENQQWKIYGKSEVAIKKFDNFVNFDNVLNEIRKHCGDDGGLGAWYEGNSAENVWRGNDGNDGVAQMMGMMELHK
ncbi:hypothetical protein Glove_117g391 [Diversispora epigaea]|uniref:Uncharacterized protein n=1 Tax=Diversispora epigaea TaxID=1348612 RepID=A0A397J0M2_9GLOM|nr:hypothetical protein Glove_117g391 [Diversispora epigaea]